MKKKNLVISIVLLLVLIKMIGTFFCNEIFISQYKKSRYNDIWLKPLFLLNLYQPYIVHYNYGNVLYQQENYTEAITAYEKALKRFPTEKRECSIRINLALAKLQALNLEDKTEDGTKKNLEILSDARETLCEAGCASSNDNTGHSKEAEQLKKDIDKMIEELKNDDEKSNNQEQNNQEETEKTIEEQLKDNMQKSNEERNETWNEHEDGKETGYYTGKNW